MATLERRVQVLFDEELYERMVSEAASERLSVGAFIREAVQTRMDQRRADAHAALQRLWARADAHPMDAPEEWERVKNDTLDRPILRDIP